MTFKLFPIHTSLTTNGHPATRCKPEGGPSGAQCPLSTKGQQVSLDGMPARLPPSTPSCCQSKGLGPQPVSWRGSHLLPEQGHGSSYSLFLAEDFFLVTRCLAYASLHSFR